MHASQPPLAGLARRSAAWLIDVAGGAAAAALFVWLAGGMSMLRTLEHLVVWKSVNGTTGRDLSRALSPHADSLSALDAVAGLLAALAVIAVAGVAYRVVTTAMWGAGIGKALLGLRVAVLDGGQPVVRPPGWSRSWRRWLVPQVPGLLPLPCTGLLAYLPAWRDPLRRGLHDRAAGTVVVDLRR